MANFSADWCGPAVNYVRSAARCPLAVPLALLLFCLAGCGGAGKPAASRSRGALQTQAAGAKSASSGVYRSRSYELKHLNPAGRAYRKSMLAKMAAINASAHLQPHLQNDRDNDQPGDDDSDNRYDTGKDPYVDYLPLANNRVYHDEDDQPYLSLGHVAGPRDRRTAASLAERYYAAAYAGDSRQACALMAQWLAKSASSKALVLNHAEHGAPYPSGIKTCTEALSVLFKRLHRHLPAAIHVTDVRVIGQAARVFFGAKAMRASQIILHREGGRWRIVQLVGKRLA